ncbi:MAG: MMPL family transporter [Planctomycetes bacterium]|nr:MMPL family transporter [Planctomycetota bacterium]
MRLDPWFDHILEKRRLLAVAAVLGLTVVALIGAVQVRPDFGIELLFPTTDPARVDYDRFKEAFPHEDAHALVIVQAPDVFQVPVLERLEALEAELAKLEWVEETRGLLSVDDIVEIDDELTVEPLLKSPRVSPAELARARVKATSDPLFAWRIASADGKSTTLRVTLTREHARNEISRTAFLHAAREVVTRHQTEARAAGLDVTLSLSGLPVIRAEGVELITGDTATLMPLAFALVTVLLFVTFVHVGEVLATLVTIGMAVFWSVGAMGYMGCPLQVLTQVTPLVVMIISVSDSAHIVTHFRAELAAGKPRLAAIASATGEAAVPCLLTEIVIAGGFLSLLSADMVMIHQFGLATAVGVLMAWLANVTVLPLALLLLGSRSVPSGETRSLSALVSFVAWVERQVRTRPGLVTLVAVVVTTLALIAGSRVGREYYNFDDLPETTAIKRNISVVEEVHGGVIPLVFFIEPTGEQAKLDEPLVDARAIALMDRLEARLEELPEVKNALSPATFLRRAHKVLAAGPAAEVPLPQNSAQAAQELLLIDDGDLMSDVLTIDRSAACVIVNMPDKGSTRAREILAELQPFLEEATRDVPFEITVTGNFMIADAVYRSLVGGLIESLGIAIGVTFLIFCLVLRSWRLALIGLVPNLLPLALTLGIMSLLGIDLKPSTVIVFSITLVIADDDTIQFLTRFRRRYDELLKIGDPDLHATAAYETLRSTGPPMLVTTLVISLGFLSLMFSTFQGIGHLGLLIGISLLTAVAADLFLTPLLLTKIRPKIGGIPIPVSVEAPPGEAASADEDV